MEEFYRRHVRAVSGFAWSQFGDDHQTEDLVAATFLAVIEAADRYDPQRGPARGWLFGIAANLIASQFRRAAAERRATQRLSGRRPVVTDDFGQLDEAIDAERLVGPPDEVLGRLPPAERELVSLLFDRLTLPEAANALGIRPGTARMRLARARARLAPYLHQREGGAR
jgi:RNA polymerase sigma factor (sigma-70 family)